MKNTAECRYCGGKDGYMKSERIVRVSTASLYKGYKTVVYEHPQCKEQHIRKCADRAEQDRLENLRMIEQLFPGRQPAQ